MPDPVTRVLQLNLCAAESSESTHGRFEPEQSEQSVAHALDPTAGATSSYAEFVEGVRRLTFVSNASSAMLVRDEPREVLGGVYELLRTELGLDCCFNYLVEDESTRLRLNFVAGVSAESVPLALHSSVAS